MAAIAIADDDAVLRDLVAFRLERDGHVVAAYDNGLDLLEACRGQRPDLVVLDLMMPGLNGLDTARALRADDVLATVPILLLTARTAEADVAHGFTAGADDYLSKPFRPSELSLRVQALLARTRGA